LTIDSPSVTEGDAGSATLTFTVALSKRSAQTVTVDWADAASGSATSGTDYAKLAGGTLTFAPNQTSKAVDVTVTGDTLDEADETVVLRLSNPSNAQLAGNVQALDGVGAIIDDDGAAAPALTIDSPSVTEGDAGSATLAFTVTLSAPSAQAVTVDWADARTGSAASGADYGALAGGTLTFAPGETSKTIDVAVSGDAFEEANETVILRLSNPSNARFAGNASKLNGIGAIIDDDGEPRLTIDRPSVSEGAPGKRPALNFTVTLSRPSSQPVTVDWADARTGSAVSGVDYGALAGGMLTFPPGETSRTIAVAVTGDVVDEPNETVVVRLSNPAGAQLAGNAMKQQAVGTIIDDDATPTATLKLTPPAIGENGGASTVTAMLSNPSSEALTLTVSAAPVSPAVAGDFKLSAGRTLTIPAGAMQSTGTVTVTAVNNGAATADKSVTISAAAAGGRGVANPADAALILIDDDGLPRILIDNPSVTEGDQGDTAKLTYTVSLTNWGSRSVTVLVNWDDAGVGTATRGKDYKGLPGGRQAADRRYLEFRTALGETSKTIEITVNGDALDEANETVVVRLYAPVNGRFPGGAKTLDGIGTIEDDDAEPTLSIDSPKVAEGDPGENPALTFNVTLSAPSGRPVTVDWADTDTGSATSGTDYADPAGGTLTFAPGETSKTIAVTVNGDAALELDETVILRLSNPSNAQFAGNAQTLDGSGAIEDDDAPALSIDSPSVAEGDQGENPSLTFTVSLSAPSPRTVTVDWADTDTGSATSGTDYADPAGGTLTFAPNETSKTVAVAVTGDALDEGNETVILRLSNPSNAHFAGNVETLDATGTITDDDTPELSIDSPSVAEGDAGENPSLTFTVTLSNPSARTVTVDWADTDTGSATSGTDYADPAGGTLTFAPLDTSKTVAVTVNGDNVNEANETVILRLSGPSNAKFAGNAKTLDGAGAINDDDAKSSLVLEVRQDRGSAKSVAESQTQKFRVTARLQNAASVVATDRTLSVVVGSASDSAREGVDYHAVADFPLVIPAKTQSGSATF
ncbi:MAG: hypothetical protein OXG70_03170, partial [Cyanobacteria bacterium MAG IRC1_bin_28]|nr:hypothetical protein [Cyanobacteria bacterium MAG IRC1_bin_28]